MNPADRHFDIYQQMRGVEQPKPPVPNPSNMPIINPKDPKKPKGPKMVEQMMLADLLRG